jgi:hypothetical protein
MSTALKFQVSVLIKFAISALIFLDCDNVTVRVTSLSLKNYIRRQDYQNTVAGKYCQSVGQKQVVKFP